MSARPQLQGFIRSPSGLRAYSMFGALVIISIFFQWATGGTFLSPLNLSNLMSQTAVTGILAVGMLLVIVSGNIDLSVGSVLGLAGGVAAMSLARWELGLGTSLLIAVAVCMAIGLLHGALVAYVGIPAFIVTLGGLLAWRGLLKGVVNSETIPVSEAVFLNIGRQYVDPRIGWVFGLIAVFAILGSVMIRRRRPGASSDSVREDGSEIFKTFAGAGCIILFVYLMNGYAGIPVPVVVMIFAALAGAFIARFTIFGRHLYAIGGNSEAARLSGVDTRRNILSVYALLGVFTGISAVIFTARLGSALPDAGTLKELDAIAACVIGGASLAGGKGTVFGAVLGALVMASLDNGMGLLGIGAFKQEIVKGMILVAAVGLDIRGRAAR